MNVHDEQTDELIIHNKQWYVDDVSLLYKLNFSISYLDQQVKFNGLEGMMNGRTGDERKKAYPKKTQFFMPRYVEDILVKLHHDIYFIKTTLNKGCVVLRRLRGYASFHPYV